MHCSRPGRVDLSTDCDASHTEKRKTTQELFWWFPTCCFNKAQISQAARGQMARSAASQLFCPSPTGMELSLMGSHCSLLVLHKWAKGSLLDGPHYDYLKWKVLDVMWSEWSCWQNHHRGWQVQWGSRKDTGGALHSCTSMHTDASLINLSRLEALSAGVLRFQACPHSRPHRLWDWETASV